MRYREVVIERQVLHVPHHPPRACGLAVAELPRPQLPDASNSAGKRPVTSRSIPRLPACANACQSASNCQSSGRKGTTGQCCNCMEAPKEILSQSTTPPWNQDISSESEPLGCFAPSLLLSNFISQGETTKYKQTISTTSDRCSSKNPHTKHSPLGSFQSFELHLVCNTTTFDTPHILLFLSHQYQRQISPP